MSNAPILPFYLRLSDKSFRTKKSDYILSKNIEEILSTIDVEVTREHQGNCDYPTSWYCKTEDDYYEFEIRIFECERNKERVVEFRLLLGCNYLFTTMTNIFLDKMNEKFEGKTMNIERSPFYNQN
jgi:hypothetical protein